MATIYEHLSYKILEKHLDTFGHVNNATYLQIYEEARWEFMTRHDYGLDYVISSQIGPVILDLHLTFKRELKNRDGFTIITEYQGQKNKLVSLFYQKMISPDNKTISTLELTVGLMDLKSRKLIAPTPEWQRVLNAR